MFGIKYACITTSILYISWFTAPSVVAKPMIKPSGENNVNITWDTPNNENGVLRYYQVRIFNELHNYTETIRLGPDDEKFVNFDQLGITYCERQ